jgi:hypothetical protein
LPADSLLPGHMPAHDANCRSLGNRVMSAPISAITTSAVRRLMPGIVSSRSTADAKGAIVFSTAALRRSTVSSI